MGPHPRRRYRCVRRRRRSFVSWWRQHPTTNPAHIGARRASQVGVVEESDLPDWPVGQHVVGFGGCCDYVEGLPGVNVLYKAGDCSGLPLTADLSVCSIIIGLTAWHGVKKVLQVTAGDTVVVSGAAGAVGSLVGQLSKAAGARVLGIAGGAVKCAQLKSEYGFDEAVDYKSQARTREHARPAQQTRQASEQGLLAVPPPRGQRPARSAPCRGGRTLPPRSARGRRTGSRATSTTSAAR